MSPDATKGSHASGVVLQTLATAGPPGPIPTVTVDGIEVVQVVQDLAHSVPLIAGKRTLVRVYLSSDATSPITIRGTLAARRAGTAGWTQIPAITDVVLNPADNGTGGLRRKREDLALSLNFFLPATLIEAGDVELALAQLETVNPTASLAVPAGAVHQVTFVAAVPLRLHVVGVRYAITTAGQTHSFEPAPIDFALIRSWLGRVYPVAQVAWSQIVVDWPGPTAWPTNSAALGIWGRDFVNPYLSALRAQDVAAGTDHRTHYYGLAADGGGFMRGWALVPSSADPAAVASGPAGVPIGSFSWDTDGSYADWYAGHELAHTFGRRHPGFCANNSHDDPAFPYPNGQLAHDDGDFVGYDSGDPEHAILPRALPGVTWHDLMTYCAHQWLSAYTYVGIYQRLIAEDALSAPGPIGASSPGNLSSATVGGGIMPAATDGIHVVARVNQTNGTGQFRFVTPVMAPVTVAQGQPASGEYVIRVKRATGPAIDLPVPFRRDACGDPSDTDVTGSIDVVILNDPSAVALELVRDGAVLDVYDPSSEPPEPKDVRPVSAWAGPTPSARAFDPSARPKITWTTAAPGPAPTIASASGSKPLYTVQVSTDDGRSWRTIGVGLVKPETTLDPQLFAGKDFIQVRVTATNGLKSKTTTQTLAVKDL